MSGFIPGPAYPVPGGFGVGAGAAARHYLEGTVDPSAGAGVAAPVGSQYLRNNGGVGEFWLKTGAANVAWTPANGVVSARGARIDNLGAPIANPNSGVAYTADLATVAYNVGGLIGAASGAGFAPAGRVCFVIPAGGDGLYDVALEWYLLAPAPSFPFSALIRSDVANAVGTYVQQVTAATGVLGYYAGMSNPVQQDAAAPVLAHDLPLVAGDAIIWVTRQDSGAPRLVDYAAFSIRRVG